MKDCSVFRTIFSLNAKMNNKIQNRRFVAFFKFHGFHYLAFGIELDLKGPQLRVFIPTGFFGIGWDYYDPNVPAWEKNAVGIK